MKKINSAVIMYMYGLNFEARAFLGGMSGRMHTLSRERACIGVAADFFPHTQFSGQF